MWFIVSVHWSGRSCGEISRQRGAASLSQYMRILEPERWDVSVNEAMELKMLRTLR